MDTQSIPPQDVNIERQREYIILRCYRDGRKLMTLKSTGRAIIDEFAGYWKSGYTQAQMLSLMQGRNIK